MTDPSWADPRGISRRTLLGAALGGLLAGTAACTSRQAGPVSVAPTAASLLRDRPFYIAHRGGGGDWPELTAYAYQQSAEIAGLKAMEISVLRSSDGVLVCAHDETTTRLTGKPYVIATTPWSTLSTLRVSGAETTSPKQPARPFTRLDDVVDWLATDYVLFVEPKVPAAVVPLMSRLVALGQPQRIVWKQPINSKSFGPAKRRGFATWGYVLNEPAHLGANLTRLAASPDVDTIGVPLSETDALCATVVGAAQANGKPTIAYTVKSTDDRRRALDLGCQGLMTSTVKELMTDQAQAPG